MFSSFVAADGESTHPLCSDHRPAQQQPDFFFFFAAWTGLCDGAVCAPAGGWLGRDASVDGGGREDEEPGLVLLGGAVLCCWPCSGTNLNCGTTVKLPPVLYPCVGAGWYDADG